MNILVTGCAGFIGGHTAQRLTVLGHEVHGYDLLTYASRSEKLDCIKTFEINDICNNAALIKCIKKNKIELIINFAAETHVDNSIKSTTPFINSNILGVASILDAVNLTGTDFIHISTDEVYGPAHGKIIFNEYSSLNPMNPYAASKAAADLMIQAYKNTHGTRARIIRPCNNFGPRQHSEKFIPTILRSIKADCKIPIYGNGLQTREWMFVKDTAKIISEIVNNKIEFDILNITTSNEMTNIDVTRKILEMLNSDFNSSVLFVNDRPGHDTRYSISSKKMNNLIDISFTDFNLAIEETVKSFLGKEND
jgi:dTDP-glucose 4,6-dehydratase